MSYTSKDQCNVWSLKCTCRNKALMKIHSNLSFLQVLCQLDIQSNIQHDFRIQWWSLLNWQIKLAVALAVALRLRCGSCKLIFWHYFIFFLLNLRTLYIVWSLVRPGSKLCATFLNITKYFKTLGCGCGAVAFILSIYLKPGLYLIFKSAWISRN